MKQIVLSALVTSVIFGLTGVSLLRKEAAKAESITSKMQAQMEAERADWEKKLKKAKELNAQTTIVTETVEVPVVDVAQTPPQQLIEELMQMGSRGKLPEETWERQIIHRFEALIAQGHNSLPAIGQFVAANQDVIYARVDKAITGDTEEEQKQLERRESSDRYQAMRRSLRPTMPDGSFQNPPTLRLGLMEAAYRIGGENAAGILASALGVTARGIEVAWLTVWLERMAPGEYKELALSAARELLSAPVALDGGWREDRLSREHLFSVLHHFKDPSYAAQAQQNIIDEDGRLDHSSLAYLKETLQENVVPLAISAYNDPRLKSSRERSRLVGISQAHFGSHPQANQFFKDLVSSQEKDDARNRYYAISSLDGGGLSDFGRNPTPKDKTLIQERMSLLRSIGDVEMDSKTLDLVEKTYKNLEKLANGEGLSSKRR